MTDVREGTLRFRNVLRVFVIPCGEHLLQRVWHPTEKPGCARHSGSLLRTGRLQANHVNTRSCQNVVPTKGWRHKVWWFGRRKSTKPSAWLLKREIISHEELVLIIRTMLPEIRARKFVQAEQRLLEVEAYFSLTVSHVYTGSDLVFWHLFGDIEALQFSLVDGGSGEVVEWFHGSAVQSKKCTNHRITSRTDAKVHLHQAIDDDPPILPQYYNKGSRHV